VRCFAFTRRSGDSPQCCWNQLNACPTDEGSLLALREGAYLQAICYAATVHERQGASIAEAYTVIPATGDVGGCIAGVGSPNRSHTYQRFSGDISATVGDTTGHPVVFDSVAVVLCLASTSVRMPTRTNTSPGSGPVRIRGIRSKPVRIGDFITARTPRAIRCVSGGIKREVGGVCSAKRPVGKVFGEVYERNR
jgi:hypothetical protein